MRVAAVGAALLGAAGATLSADGYALRAVGVVTRHGDRLPLEKAGGGFEDVSRAGLLTDDGYLRMRHLGQTLAADYSPVYAMADTPGEALPFADLHDRVRLESSGLDRTLATAEAVRESLFAGSTRKPVVFSTPDQYDLTLRGYTKCQSFRNHVADVRARPDYVAYSDATYDVRMKAGAMVGLPPEHVADLHNVWNINERLAARERRLEGNSTAADELRDVQEMRQNIVRIRDRVSALEYAVSPKTHVAGVLLRDVNGFLRGVIDASSKLRYRHWFAHYPTLVTFAEAAGLRVAQRGVPPFGASLVAEVWIRDRDGDAVLRWVWIEPAAAGGDASTTKEELRTQSAHIYFTDSAEGEATEKLWCMSCVSHDTTVLPCMRYFPKRSPLYYAEGENECVNGYTRLAVFAVALTALLIGVAFGVATRLLTRLRVVQPEAELTQHHHHHAAARRPHRPRRPADPRMVKTSNPPPRAPVGSPTAAAAAAAQPTAEPPAGAVAVAAEESFSSGGEM